MADYAFLVLPSHNRVYARSAVALVRAELGVFNTTALGGRVRDVAETVIGGVPYITFSLDGAREADLDRLANLSSLYALYAVEGGLLRPVTLNRLDTFGSDLLTIQKYAGKTNEDFTKLLVNVTAMTCDPDALLGRRLRLLDPMCGRGTTLNQALMYGLDSAGVDVDKKDFDAYSAFIRTWLKNNRFKHQAATVPVRRDRTTIGRRLDVTVGATKEAYRGGDTIALSMVNADTLESAAFFKRESFDLIVTDAPYGVQHAARPGGRGGRGDAGRALSRRPLDLLRAAVPVWAGLLRPGGAIGISWNTYVAKREELAGVLEDNGFAVCDSEPYLGLRHRVDQAIIRDVVVAKRPG
ncbi:MAG: SAM-dependent methyltransferase [Streptosporangiales bacterium]|nr:SAM-dependent methyltransferase [Streptosporangiales bacterium]